MTTPNPDVFTNVHKGIRNALFQACLALGRAGDDEQRGGSARARLREALRFVAHHGENEDLLLAPLLAAKSPEISRRLEDAHGPVNAALDALTASIDGASTAELYHRTCNFIALYLEHMRVEEQELDPGIRAALSFEELAGFGKSSVERTAPSDQRMMLAWMLPSMTGSDVEAFLARLPPHLADELRPLASATSKE